MTEPARADRRGLRDRVCRVVEYQTSPPQPPGTTARVIRLLCLRNVEEWPDREAVDAARQAAVENGLLLDWTADGGGTWRYTRTTESDLTRLARWAGERGARELVGQAYRRRQEVTA